MAVSMRQPFYLVRKLLYLVRLSPFIYCVGWNCVDHLKYEYRKGTDSNHENN